MFECILTKKWDTLVAQVLLVLGLGNSLLRDDGIGLRVIASLDASRLTRFVDDDVRIRDGGTLGLSLLPEIERSDSLIVVDAANFGGRRGEVRVFHAEAMDAQIGAARSSAHELALADLFGAARLTGALPERRALVGIAPADIRWGLEPTPEVAASVPSACAAIEAIIEGWVE